MKQKCWYDASESAMCGVEAKEHLSTWTEGKQVTCHGSESDEYGRFLATCYTNERNLNAGMVTSGNALEYRYY